MSLLNGIKGLVTDQLVSGLAGQLGESNSGIQKAMGGIVPSLLGGLLGSKQEDHSMLGGLLSKAGGLGGDNSSMIGDILGGLTGGGNSSGISGIGSSLVSGLLGNKLGGVASLISNFAGIKSGSSSSLLNIGGSLLASFLGKKMLGDKLNFGGLMNLLGGEKAEIAKAAPAGFASTLGLGNLFGDASEAVTGAVKNVTGAASNIGGAISSGGDSDNGGGGMKWLWPLLLLGALGAGIAYYMKSCKKDDTATSTEQTTNIDNSGTTTNVEGTNTAVVAPTTDTSKAAGTTTTTTTTTTETRTSTPIKLADGKEINAYAGGVEDKLVKFVTDPNSKVDAADKTQNWFDFDNLNFDLGRSTITKESMVQIDNLAAILKAYPKMKIKVGGYTDKKGEDAANLKLSQSRADAVFAALKAKGANAAQLTKAQGYGETLATVAEAASDEERRKDRRTAVRVIEK